MPSDSQHSTPTGDKEQIKRDARRLQELLREVGGGAVTQAMLEEAGLPYAIIHREDGSVAYRRFDHPAKTPDAPTENEHWRLPQTTLALECPTSESVGCTEPKLLHYKLLEFAVYLYDRDYSFSRNDNIRRDVIADVYGEDAQLVRDFLGSFRVIDDDDEVEEDERLGARESLSITAEDIVAKVSDSDIDIMNDSIEALLENGTVPVDKSTLDAIIYALDKIRAVSNDIEQNNEIFERTLKRYTRTFGYMAQYLSNAGFNAAANLLKDTNTAKDAREIIGTALKSNEIIDAYTAWENEWEEQRKKTTDESTIQSLSADRSKRKKALKAALKPLRAVSNYLDFPTRFKSATSSRMRDIEKSLRITPAQGTVMLRLETFPDDVIDSNAGAVSGDCTADDPLAFGEKTGLHNVRVIVDDRHIGNIYLLEANIQDSSDKVWHIDAVQIPIRQIDWEKFPSILIESLAPLAKELGVGGITVNVTPYHISNYDYVANGFLQFLGRPGESLNYAQMEQPNAIRPFSGTESQLAYVNFDKCKNDMSLDFGTPQGMSGQQMYLWRDDS